MKTTTVCIPPSCCAGALAMVSGDEDCTVPLIRSCTSENQGGMAGIHRRVHSRV
jgi:hypothetical protein